MDDRAVYADGVEKEAFALLFHILGSLDDYQGEVTHPEAYIYALTSACSRVIARFAKTVPDYRDRDEIVTIFLRHLDLAITQVPESVEQVLAHLDSKAALGDA